MERGTAHQLVARPHDTCVSWEIQLKCGSSLQEQGICSCVCVTSSLVVLTHEQTQQATSSGVGVQLLLRCGLLVLECAALGVTSLIMMRCVVVPILLLCVTSQGP